MENLSVLGMALIGAGAVVSTVLTLVAALSSHLYEDCTQLNTIRPQQVFDFGLYLIFAGILVWLIAQII